MIFLVVFKEKAANSALDISMKFRSNQSVDFFLPSYSGFFSVFPKQYYTIFR